MKFRNPTERALYREVVAAVAAQMFRLTDGNVKPAFAAHLACEHGIAAVHQLRTTEKAK